MDIYHCRPRLRLYSSLLIAYCNDGNIINALQCWKRIIHRNQIYIRQHQQKSKEKMQQQQQEGMNKESQQEQQQNQQPVQTQDLQLSEREYLALMKCSIITGQHHVMECVLTDLADDVLIPSKETVSTILEWFQSSHSTSNETTATATYDDDETTGLAFSPLSST